MAGKLHHENLYRGANAVEKLAEARITLGGAGALGSNLADTLVRQGFRRLRVIDRDRVEEHNLGTQIYGESDHLFRAVSVEVEAVRKELSERAVRKFLGDTELVIDTFDNSRSREVCRLTAARRVYRAFTWVCSPTMARRSGTTRTAFPAMRARMCAITRSPATWSC